MVQIHEISGLTYQLVIAQNNNFFQFFFNFHCLHLSVIFEGSKTTEPRLETPTGVHQSGPVGRSHPVIGCLL